MNKYDHVFHSLEVRGIEVMFKSNLVILTFPTGLVREYKISDFGKLEKLAKFIGHEMGIRYNG